LFGAKFEVLLYDLTSTYFESAPPDDDNDKRRFGYSRDKRSDCVQVVIALIVTPDGFPLAYEVLPGNTADSHDLAGIFAQDRNSVRQGPADLGDGSRHSHRCGAGGDAAGRSAGLLSGRNAEGTAVETGEGACSTNPGRRVREGVDVKVLPQDQETYVFAQSRAPHPQGTRHAPAQAQMALVTIEANREHEAHAQGIPDEARRRAFQGSRGVAADRQSISPPAGLRSAFTLNREKLRQVRRREGRYLLRTNLGDRDPADLWQFYIQLTEVELRSKT